MAISQGFRDKLKTGIKNGFTGGGSGKYMKWEKSQKRVTRMVPRRDPSKDPLVCGEVHYNLADSPTPCPGRNCPVNKVLWDLKEEARPDAGELFKSFGAKQQAAWVAIDRADPDRRPQLVSKGFNSKKKNGAADQMVAMFFDDTDPNNVTDLDPSDPENGFDVVIELNGDGLGYGLKAARSNSPLASTKEERDEIIQAAEALNLDAEFVCTPEHMAILESAAVKLRNGELKAKKWGDAPQKSETSGAPAQNQVDSLSTLETPPASAPAAAQPAAATAPSTPATPPPEDMAAKMKRMRETAAASKAA